MSKNNRKAWDVWLDAPELMPTTQVGRLFQNLVKTEVAATFVEHVRAVLSQWQALAQQHGLSALEIRRMSAVIQA